MASTLPSLRLLCCLALATALPVLTKAQTTTTNSPATESSASAQVPAAPLSLEDCVARAMLKNFSLRIQDYTTQNARESLTVAKADYDPTLTASSTRSSSQTYGTGVTSDGLSTRVGVEQKITTGATVSLSNGLNRGSSNYTTSTLNPAYNSDVALSISQPLLKNAGPAVNKAAIERARIGVDIAGLSFKSSVLSVIASVENAYYNLCYARQQLEVRRHSLSLANSLLEEAKAKQEQGVAIKVDVLQAQVGVANAQKNLLSSEQAVKDYEDNLLVLIGQFEFGTIIGQVTLPEAPAQNPSFDQSYKLARDNQPDLLSSHASQRQLEIDARTAKNARLPSLNLDSALGYNAKEGTPGRAYREVPSMSGYNWEIGLSLNMPWGLKAENARYRSALNSASQNRIRTQQLEQNLMADVRSAVRAVETSRKGVEISAQATQYSDETYKMVQERFKVGTATARQVLEAQDDLENARISELQAQVTLRSAITALRQIEGSSLGLYKVQVP